MRAELMLVGLVVVAGGCSAGRRGVMFGGTAPDAATNSDDTDGPPDAAAQDRAISVPDVDFSARLVPWQLEADGTAPLVLGIYDQQEKAHCRFLPDEAGELRCLPATFTRFEPTTTFADPTCQTRIYQVLRTEAQLLTEHATAIPLPRESCAPRRHLVGKMRLPPSEMRYGGAPCAPIVAATLNVNLTELVVGEVEAPERWATGTEVDGPLFAGRIRLRRVETTDGARFDDHLVDEKLDKPCQIDVELENWGNLWCRPPGLDFGAGTAGESCTGPPVWHAEACEVPAYVDHLPRLAVGPSWDGPASRRTHGCNPVTFPPTADGAGKFYEAGPPLPKDALMAPIPWATGGTGRLQLRGLPAADGSLLALPDWLLLKRINSVVVKGPVGRYFDTVAREDCNPIRTPDGILRCVPASVLIATPVSSAFSDAFCTMPAFSCPEFTSCAGKVIASATYESNGEVRITTANLAQAIPMAYEVKESTCVPTSGLSDTTYVPGAAQTSWDQYPVIAERYPRAPGAP